VVSGQQIRAGVIVGVADLVRGEAVQTTISYTIGKTGARPLCVAGEIPSHLVEAGRWGEVVRVWDGDTLTVDVEGTRRLVRLLGMDAPEMHGARGQVERFAMESRDALHQLCYGCKVLLVRTECQGPVDVYGRWRAFALRDPDGINIGLEMVRQGWARCTPQWPCELTGTMRLWESWARTHRLGMWR
jgi:endonuclease YncB( thermonuclease family)